MIQRIQSIFLLLAAISALVLFFVQIKYPSGFKMNDTDALNTLTVCYITEYQSETNDFIVKTLIIPALLCTLLVILPIINIFMYKNRRRQSLISRLNILVGTGLLVYLLFFLENKGGTKALIGDSMIHYLILALPALAIIFSYLANLFIMKDERLIKSADRIR